jgi:hypothetical protein
MTEFGSHSKTTSGLERRSKLYFIVGNILVVCIGLSFFGFMTRNYLQNTLWKDYYYKNAFKFSEACSAQFSGSDSIEFPMSFAAEPKKLGGLPHPRGFFDSWDTKTSPYYHALYRCDIQTADVRIGKGVNYMHIGWIFGEAIEVSVAGRKTIEIQGDDFVSFPVTQAELSKPSLDLQIRVSSKNRHRFGLASILPPVITTETKDHISVLGIQPIYEMMNVVLPLIPAIVLGMLLGFAWLIGLKTRIVMTGMFYFVTVLISGSLPLLIPYLPFSATKVYTIGMPLSYLAHITVLCLMLEVFGILKTKIYHLMNGALCLTTVSAIVMLGWDGIFPYSQLTAKTLDSVLLTAWVALGVKALKVRLRERAKLKKRLFTASLAIIAAIIYRFVHDILRHLEWNSYVSIDFYYSFAMPLFITGIVFYYLSWVEAELKIERQEKRRMKQGIAVSQDLLSVLKEIPAQLNCSFADIKWNEALMASNAWRTAWMTESGDLLVVCGQLKGSEDLAALGQVAIQAALIQCQEQKIYQPGDCLDVLNRSLVKLFHNYVRSDAGALLVRKDFTAFFASSGETILTFEDVKQEVGSANEYLGVAKNSSFKVHNFQLTANSKVEIAPSATVGGAEIAVGHLIRLRSAS